jgi:hypothetical protein
MREREKERKNRWWLHPTPPVYAHVKAELHGNRTDSHKSLPFTKTEERRVLVIIRHIASVT